MYIEQVRLIKIRYWNWKKKKKTVFQYNKIVL